MNPTENVFNYVRGKLHEESLNRNTNFENFEEYSEYSIFTISTS